MAEPGFVLSPDLWRRVLQGFMVALNGGWVPLTESSKWLWSQIATWYLILATMYAGTHEDETGHLDMAAFLRTVLRATVKVAVVFILIVNMQWITDKYLNAVVSAGLIMSSGITKLFPSLHVLTAEEFLSSPGHIVFQAFEVTKPIMAYLENLGFLGKITSMGMRAIFEVSVSFTNLMFLVIAAHVLVLVVAVQVSVFLMLLFLAFILFDPTKFMALGPIHDFFTLSTRLTVLAFVCGIVVPMLSWLAFPTDPVTGLPLQEPTTWTVLSQAAAALVFAALSWVIPHYMHMQAGHLLGPVTGAIGGAIAMARRAL